MEKRRVLIFIAHYLPGFKMGGPISSIVNLTSKLENNFDFSIITNDRDLGDVEAYKGIIRNDWISVNGCKVMYFVPNWFYYYFIIKHLRRNRYDVIYLNSFFDFRFSIFIVLSAYLKIITIKELIIAPRGELFDEALSFKMWKKKIFLFLFKAIGLYNKITWHSTSNEESEVIYRQFPNSFVKVARVISDNSSELCEIKSPEFHFNNDNLLKLVFISRVSKDKNLRYGIKLLSGLNFDVEFHIYGPLEDIAIWNDCLKEIKLLPSNIKVFYKGEILRKQVKSYFVEYDLFLFPTHRENFGHVINESLSVGTPVLISDNTPWRDLAVRKLGWDVNLKKRNDFIEVLKYYGNLSHLERANFRENVKRSYNEYYNQEKIIKENLDLLK